MAQFVYDGGSTGFLLGNGAVPVSGGSGYLVGSISAQGQYLPPGVIFDGYANVNAPKTKDLLRAEYARAMQAQVAEMEAGLQLIVDKKLQQKGSVGRMDLKAQKFMVFNVASGAVVHTSPDLPGAEKWVKARVSQDRGEYAIYEAKAVIRPKPIETESETL